MACASGASPFHHRWAKARAEGLDLPLSAFSLATELAGRNRFAMPTWRHALDPVDARLCLSFRCERSMRSHLRGIAEAAGVTRVEGMLRGRRARWRERALSPR
jgi:tryptophan halogenase